MSTNSTIIIDESIKTTAQIAQGFQAASVIAATIGASIGGSYGSGASAFVLLNLNRFLFYIRLMDISYPQNLKDYFYTDSNPDFLALGFSIPKSNIDFSSGNVEPKVFGGWGLGPSYLDNYWQTLLSIAISLGVLLFLKGLEKLGRKLQKPHLLYFLSNFGRLFQWTFPLIQFCTGFDTIVLYAFLEFNSYKFDTGIQIFSFLLAVFCIVLMFFFLGFTIYLENGNEKSKMKVVPENEEQVQKPEKEFRDKWKSFRILFTGNNEDSMVGRRLISIFMVRTIAWAAMIIFLYAHPMAQGFIMTIISLAMFIIFLTTKPFTDKFSKIEILVLEFLVFFISITFLALACMESFGIKETATRSNIGYALIAGFFSFVTMAVIFQGTHFVFGIISSVKKYKKLKTEGQLSCLLIVSIPFEAKDSDFKTFEVIDLTVPKKKKKPNKEFEIISLDQESPVVSPIPSPRPNESKMTDTPTKITHAHLPSQSQEYQQLVSTPRNLNQDTTNTMPSESTNNTANPLRNLYVEQVLKRISVESKRRASFTNPFEAPQNRPIFASREGTRRRRREDDEEPVGPTKLSIFTGNPFKPKFDEQEE